MTSIPTPNEYGVYVTPTETLALPNPQRGWKGAPLAEIDLLRLPDGWRSAIGAQLSARGRGEPITARCPAFANRDAALANAIERLRSWCGQTADAKPVLGWLDTLIPAQPDLFSGARNV